MIVVGVEDVSINVVVSAVPVVATHHVIKMDVLHSVEDMYSGIALVAVHAITVVMNRVIIAVVALVLLVVRLHVEIVLERVTLVVLVPPIQGGTLI